MDRRHDAGGHKTEAAAAREWCDRVERLASEADAGRAVTLAGCDPLLWELLIVWRRREAEHERLFKSDTAAVAAALKAMLGPISDVWAAQAEDLRASLGYESAPALERVLIEHAIVCWLRLAVMEVRYSAVVAASNTLTRVEHTERRLTAAQKRFTRACESLARVRKLSRPSVQINVAEAGGRQLNVAAAG